MQFSYTAKDAAGKVLKGVLSADDTANLAMKLKEQNLYLVNAHQKTGKLTIFKKVPTKEKLIFTEQLGVMINSGTSLVEGLQSIQEEIDNPYFSDILNQVITDIKGGVSFSDALKKHPKIFSSVFVNMIKSGEESGKLDLTLNRLTIQIENDYELNRKIKNALAYPAFILVALVAVMIIVMTFVIPQLTQIFDESGVKLPALTRIVIGISHFFKNYIIYILVGLVLLIIGGKKYRSTKAGREVTDKAILRIPVVGNLLRKCYLARFARTFSSLSASGVPLVEVFNVSGDTIGNTLYQSEIEKMVQGIKSGKSVSTVFKASENFPRIVGQMALVGERSGNIDQVFEKLANFFDRDVESLSSNISTMLEPILMVVIGIGIGIIIISVLQPIYGMVNAV